MFFLQPPIDPTMPDYWCYQYEITKEVKVHSSYTGYYERLSDLMTRLVAEKKGGEIFIIGWTFTLGLELFNKRSVLDHLKAAVQAGISVKLLLSDHVGDNARVQIPEANKIGIKAFLDKQLLTKSATHHQKCVFLRNGNEWHLFVGGMDIAEGRKGLWYDMQAEVIGQGAYLGVTSMDERWNSVVPDNLMWTNGNRPKPQYDPQSGTDANVQFVRTYPPLVTNPVNSRNNKSLRKYAVFGDHTYYQLICNAISYARKSIYCEDQFLYGMNPHVRDMNSKPEHRSYLPANQKPLMTLLADALKSVGNKNLKIVLVTGSPDGLRSDFKDVDKSRASFVDGVRNSLKKGSFCNIYETISNKTLFLHTKTWIFDDELIVIGSANIWNQSYFSGSDLSPPSESEYGVAFASNNGEDFGFPGVSAGRAIRIAMWEKFIQAIDPKFSYVRNDKNSFTQELAQLLDVPNLGRQALNRVL